MNKNIVPNRDYKLLLEKYGKNFVSMYIPTHRKGEEVNEGNDVLQYKSMLKEVEGRLNENALSEKQIDKYLGEAYSLIDDKDFWHQQSETLAVFIGKNIFEKYKLPIRTEAMFHVGPNFYIKPLIPLFNENGQFYMLTLSKEMVKLFYCSRFSMSEVPLKKVAPVTQKEALKWDNPERSVQHHYGDKAAQSPIYHGHGKTKDVEMTDLERFFDKVDKGLLELLEERQIPLILVGLDHEVGSYKNVSHYPALVDEFVSANPNSKTFKELHRQAYEKVQSYLNVKKERAIERFHKLAGTEKTTTSLDKIIRASHFKEVDAVFLSRHKEDMWGKFDPKKDNLEIHDNFEAGDEKLLNKTSIETLKNGGNVYLVDDDQMPAEDTPAAALLRF
jgi:hypothetical protein